MAWCFRRLPSSSSRHSMASLMTMICSGVLPKVLSVPLERSVWMPWFRGSMVLYLSASLRIGVKSSVEARERNERFDFRAKKKSPKVSCRNLQILLPPRAQAPNFFKGAISAGRGIEGHRPRIEAEIDAVSDQIAEGIG